MFALEALLVGEVADAFSWSTQYGYINLAVVLFRWRMIVSIRLPTS